MSKRIISFDRCVFTLVGVRNLLSENDDVLINYIDLDEKKHDNLILSINNYDTAIVSIGMIDYHILYTIQNLTDLRGNIRIIVILDGGNYALLQLLRCMGLSLIITRDERLNVIMDIITDHKIKNYISEGLSKLLDDVDQFPAWERTSISNTSQNNTLSPMELKVLIPLINGVRPSYLARKYSISVKTVSNHKINALSKIGISNVAMLFHNHIHYPFDVV